MSEIGKLRYRVTIQTRSTGAGAVVWSNTATTWAEVKSQYLPSAETDSPSAVRSITQYLVRFRNRTVSASQRLLWSGKTLQIHGVRPLDTSYSEALCSEVQ